MSNSHSSLFGLTSKVEVARKLYKPTQRGRAFTKYLIGSWLMITGGALLIDLSAEVWGGCLLLAVPVVYSYVARNYPAEFTKAQLEWLREDDDVVRIYGYDSGPANEGGCGEASIQDLVKRLVRIKTRMKLFEYDNPSDCDIIDEVYDELADLGLYVTRSDIETWTSDFREEEWG